MPYQGRGHIALRDRRGQRTFDDRSASFPPCSARARRPWPPRHRGFGARPGWTDARHRRSAGNAQGGRDGRLHRAVSGLAVRTGHLARHRLPGERSIHRRCAGERGRCPLHDRSAALQGGGRPGGGPARGCQDQGRSRQDQSRSRRGAEAHGQCDGCLLPGPAAGLPRIAGARQCGDGGIRERQARSRILDDHSPDRRQDRPQAGRPRQYRGR